MAIFTAGAFRHRAGGCPGGPRFVQDRPTDAPHILRDPPGLAAPVMGHRPAEGLRSRRSPRHKRLRVGRWSRKPSGEDLWGGGEEANGGLWWGIVEGVQESVKEREAVLRGEGAKEVEDVVLVMAWGAAAQEVLGGEEIEAEGVEDIGEGDDAGVGDAAGFDLGDEAGGDVGATGQLAL